MKYSMLTIFLSFQVMSATMNINFAVDTNVPGINFEGKLKNSKTVDLFQGKVKKITLNPKELTTGIELRDEHMQEKIFQHKAIYFVIKNSNCSASSEQCEVSGDLTFNSKSLHQQFKFVKESNKLISKKEIKLTDYGIILPSYMGVKVDNTVPVEIILEN